jgi:K+-sensing histidine kinase KdpD
VSGDLAQLPVLRGRLHVFLGVAPGVGKTFAMLEEGLSACLSYPLAGGLWRAA